MNNDMHMQAKHSNTNMYTKQMFIAKKTKAKENYESDYVKARWLSQYRQYFRDGA